VSLYFQKHNYVRLPNYSNCIESSGFCQDWCYLYYNSVLPRGMLCFYLETFSNRGAHHMLKVIPFAHQLMKDIVEPGDTVIDATCGNGNDALFLSTLVGASGHVYACDIQEQAIIATKELLASNERTNLTYIQDSHANIDQYLPTSVVGHITAAVFNLGYLPKSDKSIITKPHSTIKAMEHILSFLKKSGRLIAVIY